MEQKKLLRLAEKEDEKIKETYIDFTFAYYALADVLLVLDNNGIKDFSITKEDGELHIRIPKSYLVKLKDNYATRDGECYE